MPQISRLNDAGTRLRASPSASRVQAKRARGGVVVTLGLIVAVLVLVSQRRELFPGLGTETRSATVVLLVVLGWALDGPSSRPRSSRPSGSSRRTETAPAVPRDESGPGYSRPISCSER